MAPNYQHASLGENACYNDHTPVIEDEEQQESALAALVKSRAFGSASINEERSAVQIVSGGRVIAHFAVSPERLEVLRRLVQDER